MHLRTRALSTFFAPILRLHILLLLLLSIASLRASDDNDDWQLGPIGGTFRTSPGTNQLKIKSVTAGQPGAAAGLQVDDLVYGAFGADFGTLSTEKNMGYLGAPQDLGIAIERAEQGDGQLPLRVLRPGTGGLTITVNIPAAGAFGPAYPRGSAKFNALYEWAAGQIHSQTQASSNGDFGYDTGWFGLILLSHPNWADTSGAKPYRNSINKLRARTVTHLDSRVLAPVKATEAGHVDPGLENWDIGSSTMFLAEYINKTGDTSVMPSLQRACDALANRIQLTGEFPGHMGHGGVEGDYGNWALNIINIHAHAAFAMAKRAGAVINQSKWDLSWNNCLKGATARQDGHPEDGYVDYGPAAWGQGNGYDASARTAGSIFGFLNYGQVPTADDSDALNRMKGYVVRQWPRFQRSHAYTVGGVCFTYLGLPYLSDRDEQYVREQLRFFFHYHRQPNGTLAYFGGRGNNGGDDYLDLNRVKLINVAMAQATTNGGLPSLPPLNTSRIYTHIKSPWLSWPTPAARYGRPTSSSVNFVVDVQDYLGNVLAPGTYSAAWTSVSGPGVPSFTSVNTANTTVTFPAGGRYRLRFDATLGGYTNTEIIDLDIHPGAPAGYTLGRAQYEGYTDVQGTTLADLTGAPKYPAQPDEAGFVTSLQGIMSGNDYGQRIRGYIIPAQTGSYRFYIASDDSSQFKFNKDGTPIAGAVVVASVSGSTGTSEWNKFGSQQSQSYTLTAGQPYYFEVLHKEGGGADHVSVGWTGPGFATTTVIPGAYLATADSVGPPVITTQPQGATLAAGDSTTLSVRVDGAGPFAYQWRLNGVAYWPASASPVLPLTNVGAGAAGTYDCVVTGTGGTATSNTATITVTGVGDLVQGGLWRDVFTGVGGGAVADLISGPGYPRFPASGGVITKGESPAEYGDSYGQRWTGWLKVPTTGNYRLLLCSDDSAEVWLSPDQHPVNRVKVAQRLSYNDPLSWSSAAASSYIALEAGQRYFIEVLHKEAGGGDHCAIQLQKQGDPLPTNGTTGLAGTYLEYLSGGVYSDYVAPNVTLVKPAATSVKIPANVGVLLEASVGGVSGITASWTKVSGPGTATFDNPASFATGVTFSASGTYVLRCTATNGQLTSNVDVTVQSGATPVAFTNLDISTPRAGSGSESGGTYTVTGAGANISGTSDTFHYYYKSFAGDFDIRARVFSKSATATGAHGALMVRASTAANSANVAVSSKAAALVQTQSRATDGATTSVGTSVTDAPPVWLRLVRSGNSFTGYYSADGATWTSSGNYTVTLPSTALVGFAVSNGSSLGTTAVNTVVFDNVSGITPNIGATVAAGTDATVTLPNTAPVNGTASDDGKPVTPLVTTWTNASGPGTVTFGNAAALSTTASFSVPGSYVVRLVGNDGEVQTFDDKAVTADAATVTLTATDSSAAEPGTNTGTFTISRTGATTSALTINFGAPTGTATYGTDYSALPASVTIPSGQSTATITVTPTDDASIEGSETVSLALAAGQYNAGNPASATVTIADNDVAPTVTITSPVADTVNVPSTVGLILSAAVSDDGLPNPLALTWSRISGPGTATFANTGAADTGVTFTAPGIYVLRLTANDGTFQGSDDVTVRVLGAPGLATFLDADIGTVAAAGSYNEVNAVHTLTAQGGDIWNSADSFHFAYESIAGDVEIIARVTGVTNNHSWTKAGVMIRETTAANSKHAIAGMASVSSNGAFFQWRSSTGGGSGNSNTATSLPYWVRLVRTGNNLSAYRSPDGVSWTQQGATQAITMTATVQVGLALCSNNTSQAATATFDNVTINGSPIVPRSNHGPVISAGPDRNVTLPSSASLDGTLADDAKPNPPANVTVAWSKQSGPGTVTFGNGVAVDTTASMTTDGAYTLRLVADDGEVKTFDEMLVTVAPAPWTQWQQSKFGANAGNPAIAGAMADPDRDGSCNALEYATGTEPMLAGPSSVTYDIETIGSDRYLRLTTPKNPAATDVVLTVEVTGALGNPATWNTTQTLVEQNTSTLLRVRDTIPVSSATQRNIRLRVSFP